MRDLRARCQASVAPTVAPDIAPGIAPNTAPAAERGSAYLFVLLALLVLTIIGLSLVVVTQTEAQIGGAEKSATRILFGAESGLHAQVGLHFLELDPLDRQFTLNDDDLTTGAGAFLAETTEVVDVSPFYPIYYGPCALCSVNHGSDQRYYVNNYVVNARAQRYGDLGCRETAQATKLLSAMYMIQPEPQPGGGVDEPIREYDPTLISTDPCIRGLFELLY